MTKCSIDDCNFETYNGLDTCILHCRKRHYSCGNETENVFKEFYEKLDILTQTLAHPSNIQSSSSLITLPENDEVEPLILKHIHFPFFRGDNADPRHDYFNILKRYEPSWFYRRQVCLSQAA